MPRRRWSLPPSTARGAALRWWLMSSPAIASPSPSVAASPRRMRSSPRSAGGWRRQGCWPGISPSSMPRHSPRSPPPTPQRHHCGQGRSASIRPRNRGRPISAPTPRGIRSMWRGHWSMPTSSSPSASMDGTPAWGEPRSTANSGRPSRRRRTGPMCSASWRGVGERPWRRSANAPGRSAGSSVRWPTCASCQDGAARSTPSSSAWRAPPPARPGGMRSCGGHGCRARPG